MRNVTAADARSFISVFLLSADPASASAASAAEWSPLNRHASLMSGVLSAPLKPAFVGRLECASTDWAAVARRASWLYLERQPDGEHGDGDARGVAAALVPSAHVTSSDPQGARAAMRALLTEDPKVRRAVCHLIRRDYSCFGYNFEACLDGSALLPSALPSRQA
jgi:hypothetical protein